MKLYCVYVCQRLVIQLDDEKRHFGLGSILRPQCFLSFPSPSPSIVLSLSLDTFPILVLYSCTTPNSKMKLCSNNQHFKCWKRCIFYIILVHIKYPTTKQSITMTWHWNLVRYAQHRRVLEPISFNLNQIEFSIHKRTYNNGKYLMM